MEKELIYSSRNQFGKLFQQHNELGIGAEIGVRYGMFSRALANDWKGKILCVDLWDNNEIFEVAQVVLEKRKFKLHKGESVHAAGQYENETFDWIYIDAGHTFREVEADFYAWHSKVRSGGIVSGHDYGDNGFGVKPFIDQYIEQHPEIKIHFTTDDLWEGTEYQSWWFIKP